jgi:3-phenylpropionate/cinnamic acid dioxygenase small subunit
MADDARDRIEIAEVLARYANALDDRDWSRLASCFTPDATADYGGAGACSGFTAIETLCRRALEPLDASQHLVGSIEVEVAGDEARARCALQAQHTRRGCEGGDHFTIGGSYRDCLVRTKDGWRIRHRELRVGWQDGNPRVMRAPRDTER